jgi:CRP/FNR family transcriptional regulator, cyclic AMP receptor protein
MEGLERIVLEHPFFSGLQKELGAVISGCARNLRFEAGQYLFHEGDPADEFFLVRHGVVALEITPPGREPLVISTVPEGEIVGVSWLVPPYRWVHDARAVELTRVIGLNAKCLRTKCDADDHLGYEMMKRFVPILMKRLRATRLQLLDVYGKPNK